MDNIIPYALITDDPVFASVISTYFNEENKYFPVFSLPRMTRIDWEFEVGKRIVSINRLKLHALLCKYEDYGLLAPLRDKLNCPLYALQTSEEVKRFIQFNFPSNYIDFPHEQYREGLIQAKKTKRFLRLEKACNKNTSDFLEMVTSDTIIVIEKTNDVTDIAAINYALAYNYDVKFIDVPNRIVLQDKIKIHFLNLAEKGEMTDESHRNLSNALLQVVDYKWLESKYRQILFFTSYIPYGILIESSCVSHLFHLQSDLRLSDEFYYLEFLKDTNIIFSPSFLFVDMESANLNSEIPTISNYLTKYKHWSSHINGKFATRLNFKMHVEFFPYDLLLVTGHGDSPKCRKVEYEFESNDRKKHKILMLEYFQFGPSRDDKIEVEVKQYPLSVDGVDWKDKDTLKKNGISHLFFEFVHSDDKSHKVIYECKAQPKTIEGLLLSDGVFLGMPGIYAHANNPIILINTCGSLLELGEHFSFMGCRAFIGTMWSIYDKDAQSFAIDLFNKLTTNSVLNAFQYARSRIANRYSKFAYCHYGTFHSHLPIRESILSDQSAYETMAKRLLSTLQNAIDYYQRGWLKPYELKIVLTFLDSTNKFISKHLPKNEFMRQQLNTIRSTLITLGV
jgi:hypothetical protein